MKLSPALLSIFLSAAAVDAKIPKGVKTKFCYRDGATASVDTNVDYSSNSYDYDSALALVDLGHLTIGDDEAVLVEATVQHLFAKGLDMEGSSASIDIEGKALMGAALFKGCTSLNECQTNNIPPIYPKPSALVPIKIGEFLLRYFLLAAFLLLSLRRVMPIASYWQLFWHTDSNIPRIFIPMCQIYQRTTTSTATTIMAPISLNRSPKERPRASSSFPLVTSPRMITTLPWRSMSRPKPRWPTLGMLTPRLSLGLT